MLVLTASMTSLVATAVGGAVVGLLVSVAWQRLSTRKRQRIRISGDKAEKKLKVYHTRTYRSTRVAWIVAELGVEEDFEFVDYDPYTADEQARAWYRGSVHPHGTVPALVDDNTGKVLVESVGICLYLADRYGQLAPPPSMAADYYDWCVYASATVDPCLIVFDLELVKKAEDQDSAAIEEATATADLFVRRLDDHIASRPFICGQQFTAADVVVGYCVMWASVIKGGKLIVDYANVKAYLNRLKSRPTFTRTVGTPREWINAAN